MADLFNGAFADKFLTEKGTELPTSKVTEYIAMTEKLLNSSGFSTANYDAFLINLADNNASVEDLTFKKRQVLSTTVILS